MTGGQQRWPRKGAGRSPHTSRPFCGRGALRHLARWTTPPQGQFTLLPSPRLQHQHPHSCAVSAAVLLPTPARGAPGTTAVSNVATNTKQSSALCRHNTVSKKRCHRSSVKCISSVGQGWLQATLAHTSRQHNHTMETVLKAV